MGYWSVPNTEKMLDKLQSCFCGDRIAASKEIIGSFPGLPEEKISVIVSEYDVVLTSKGYRKKTRKNYRLQIKWFLEWYRQNPAKAKNQDIKDYIFWNIDLGYSASHICQAKAALILL